MATDGTDFMAPEYAERDRIIWHALLRADSNSNGYIGPGGKEFLSLLANAHMAWIKLTALKIEVYAYSAEDGERIASALKYLGSSDAWVDSFDHWRDGETHMVKGSLL